MAQHHTVTVETVGYFTFIAEEGEDVIQNWIETDEDYNIVDNIDVCVYSYGQPEIVEDKLTEQGRQVTLKTLASINKNIITSDEEYKVHKLIDWDEELTSDSGKVSIRLDYKEKYSVIDDDSWWVDDSELENDA